MKQSIYSSACVSLILMLCLSVEAQKPELIVQTGHLNSVISVVFSPDGRTLASAGTDDTVKLWDVAAGRELRSLIGPAGSLAFSPDGKLLAGGGRLNIIKLWDVATGKELYTLKGHTELVTSVAFSPDGKLLASGGNDATVRLWDVTTGTELRTLKVNSSVVYSVAFSPDGKTLATGNSDNIIRLWDVMSGQEVRSLSGHKSYVGPVVFSPDGKLLASGSSDKTVKLWNVSTGQELLTLSGHTSDVYSVAFGPDGKTLASTNKESIRLWDVTTGRELRTLSGQAGTLFQINFSPDGRLLASGSGDGTIKLWNAATGQEVRTFSSHIGLGGLGIFSPDGKLFANGRLDNTIRVWDVSGGQGMLRTLRHTEPVFSVAFSYDGKILAAGGDDGGIKLWNVASGQELITIKGHESTVDSLALSPDGKLLASGSHDQTIKLWNVSTGALVRTFRLPSAWIFLIAFSPDGRQLASLSEEKTLNLWEVDTGRELATPPKAPEWMKVPFVARVNNQAIRAYSLDAEIRLVDISTKQELATLIALDEKDWVVVTPDGLFDGSPAGWDKIIWRFNNNTFDYKPVEAYFNEFYYPGLLASIFAGKRPRAPSDISRKDRRQPQLKIGIAAPRGSGLTPRNAAVRVEVSQSPGGAKDVRLFRNGSLVKLWRGDVLKGRARTTLETVVPIVAGENSFTAYAFNRDNIKSSDAQLTINGDKSLERKGTAYILAVGINVYANAGFNLKYAVNDAEAFGKVLSEQQNRLKQFARIEVIPLLDKEATKENILLALKRLAGASTGILPQNVPRSLLKIQKAQPEDEVVVFFAGHGTVGPALPQDSERRQQRRFYLLPYDLGYTGPRPQVWDDPFILKIAPYCVSDRELERAFERVDAGKLLLVIDACQSGQALDSDERRRGPMNSKGLAQLAYEKGMYILTAAQSYQAAKEAARLGHGYLTYALVEEGLKTKAADADRDGAVTEREWFDFATELVPKMQEEKMKEVRGEGKDIAFVAGEEDIPDPEKRNVQRPRVFYRRELDVRPLIVARP